MDSHILYSIVVMPLLVFLVAAAPDESCSSDDVKPCMDKLSTVINNPNLMNPTNRKDLGKTCGMLREVLQCYNDNLDRCFDPSGQYQESVRVITSKLQKSMDDACSHDSALNGTPLAAAPDERCSLDEVKSCMDKLSTVINNPNLMNPTNQEDLSKACGMLREVLQCDNDLLNSCLDPSGQYQESMRQFNSKAQKLVDDACPHDSALSSTPLAVTSAESCSLNEFLSCMDESKMETCGEVLQCYDNFTDRCSDTLEKNRHSMNNIQKLVKENCPHDSALNSTQNYVKQPCDLAEEFDRCNEITHKKIPSFAKGYLDGIPKEDKRKVCCIINENKECKNNAHIWNCSSKDNYTEHENELFETAMEVCTEAGLDSNCISSAPVSTPSTVSRVLSCALYLTFIYLTGKHLIVGRYVF